MFGKLFAIILAVILLAATSGLIYFIATKPQDTTFLMNLEQEGWQDVTFRVAESVYTDGNFVPWQSVTITVDGDDWSQAYAIRDAEHAQPGRLLRIEGLLPGTRYEVAFLVDGELTNAFTVQTATLPTVSDIVDLVAEVVP